MMHHGDSHGFLDSLGYRDPHAYRDSVDYVDPVHYRDPIAFRDPLALREPFREPPRHREPLGHGDPMSQRPGLDGERGRVSSRTNAVDFVSKDSRVFVGNLNTLQLSKEDVHGIFGRFGQITAISMHKGYAFVQFNHPGEARRAVTFENGQTYGGQALDLNITSEPKIRGPKKRSAPVPAGSDRRSLPPRSPAGPSEEKRARHEVNISMQRSNLVPLANNIRSQAAQLSARPTARPGHRPGTQSSSKVAAAAAVKRATTTITKASVTGTVDVLICGQCKRQFNNLHSLAQHKKIPCRLNATSCECLTNPPEIKEDPEPEQLQCAQCEKEFSSAWDLCQHCQSEHSLSIYSTKKEGL